MVSLQRIKKRKSWRCCVAKIGLKYCVIAKWHLSTLSQPVLANIYLLWVSIAIPRTSTCSSGCILAVLRLLLTLGYCVITWVRHSSPPWRMLILPSNNRGNPSMTTISVLSWESVWGKNKPLMRRKSLKNLLRKIMCRGKKTLNNPRLLLHWLSFCKSNPSLTKCVWLVCHICFMCAGCVLGVP